MWLARLGPPRLPTDGLSSRAAHKFGGCTPYGAFDGVGHLMTEALETVCSLMISGQAG